MKIIILKDHVSGLKKDAIMDLPLAVALKLISNELAKEYKAETKKKK